MHRWKLENANIACEKMMKMWKKDSAKASLVLSPYVRQIRRLLTRHLFNSMFNHFILTFFQDEQARSDSYRYAVQPKMADDGGSSKKKKKSKKDKKEELEDLKQELDMVGDLFHEDKYFDMKTKFKKHDKLYSRFM